MAIFDEANTTEQMVIDTLVKNGWKYIPAAKLDRNYKDVMVESMVKEALIRLNPVIAENPDRADEVIYKLRNVILSARPHDLVAQNEVFKKLVFEENSFPFGENGEHVTIHIFGTETDGTLDQNECVVTNQWIFPRVDGGCRFDIVLLINGIPVSVGELKTPVRSSITWLDGANDIADYERMVPQMFVPSIFNFASEGKCYRYGSVNMPCTMWGPWHTPDHKDEGTLEDVRISIADMITPAKVMDIFRFFTLYSTDKRNRKIKIICRYQQYEGANLIIQRVLENKIKKGLIWHFQGSGKSLLMVFAAQKMTHLPKLNNPTVLIVTDRIDLDSQITATFNAADVTGLLPASSCEDLENILKSDMRKIIFTTIFKFEKVTRALSLRDNVIVMVDECHRTQYGDLGDRMRTALPRAFFFGLTGTPINRVDKNTFATFGATEDRNIYLSKYSFSDSIRDGATLPLEFEPVPVDLKVDKEKLDAEFAVLTEGLTEREKAELSRRVNMKAIMYNPERIRSVCQHIAYHYTSRIAPNGYKGQVVCYDRECCLLYKQELDKLLGEDATTIVMDTNNDPDGRYKAYSRDRDAEARLLDDFREPTSKIKLVIVTAKLLTGFDAPILQVMYLDKPMKDHTLLQAICRTNRTYDSGKTFGLIVDYIGIFDNVAQALGFDPDFVNKVITNINELKKVFPEKFKKCIDYFVGVDRTLKGFEGLMAAQDCLPTNNDKDNFGADYRVLNKLWNAISPDEFLSEYKDDYVWLSGVYESLKPPGGGGAAIWAALGAKTIELINNNVTVEKIRFNEPAYYLEQKVIDVLMRDPVKGTREIAMALNARLALHGNDPVFIELGRKLEALKQQHAQQLINATELLKALLQLATETAQAEKQLPPQDTTEQGKAALTELFNEVQNERTPIIVKRIVDDIDNIVRVVRFPGWQKTSKGVQDIQSEILKILWVQYKIKDREIIDKAYSYVEQYY